MARDQFGYSVSLSGDGSAVAVGAPSFGAAPFVRILRLDGSSLIPLGNAILGNQSSRFGQSVSLSGNGSTVAVGAPHNDDGGVDAGQVRTFRWDGSSWTQLGDALNGEDTWDRWLNDKFGYSVSLSGDGSAVAVGSPYNGKKYRPQMGQVRTFRWDGSSWTQLGDALNGKSTCDNFGYSVSLSGDGSTVAVGAPKNNDGGVDAGQVRTFR